MKAHLYDLLGNNSDSRSSAIFILKSELANEVIILAKPTASPLSGEVEQSLLFIFHSSRTLKTGMMASVLIVN